MRLFSMFLIVLIAAALMGQQAARSGIHPEDMDTTCQPCTDFWRYVNGGWLAKNPIPAKTSSWGTFSVLSEGNQERMRTVVEAAAGDTTSRAGSDERKMGDLYASCMDTATIDRRAIAPLQPDLDRIGAVKSVSDLGRVLTEFQRMGRPYGATNGEVVGAFRLTSEQDRKDPARVVASIVERDGAGRAGTSILSMPDRDYYFKNDPKSQEIRAAFLEHATRMLELVGSEHAAAAEQAKTVLAFETRLAEPVMPIAEKRDPDKTYHLMTVRELAALAPRYDWAGLMSAEGLPGSVMVNVPEPKLLERFNAMLADEPLETWKLWLRWRTLKLSAPYLGSAIAKENFHFERTVLAGVKEEPPRWQTCVAVVDRNLSDALSRAYTAKYFPPAAKDRMRRMVEDLRAAMKEAIEQSEWMQPVTKQAALKKLSALDVQIGYPDRWRDYTPVEMARERYFENIRNAWMFGDHLEIARIGKPVDRTYWTMTAPTVNAYSSQSYVKLVFPAGILEPPFFDMQADDAANYGAIGVVIGHEMGHQFDDGGSKFDAAGELRNWWTGEDRAKFDARTACVVNQFNTLDVGGGQHHNGRQVLGEALGDLGGLAVAYRAYHRSLGGKDGPVLDGYTADQRFFIAFARTWGTQYRPEAARLLLNTNNHPLPEYRALATLQNSAEFARAFHCKPGDRMVRPEAERCQLW